MKALIGYFLTLAYFLLLSIFSPGCTGESGFFVMDLSGMKCANVLDSYNGQVPHLIEINGELRLYTRDEKVSYIYSYNGSFSLIAKISRIEDFAFETHENHFHFLVPDKTNISQKLNLWETLDGFSFVDKGTVYEDKNYLSVPTIHKNKLYYTGEQYGGLDNIQIAEKAGESWKKIGDMRMEPSLHDPDVVEDLLGKPIVVYVNGIKNETRWTDGERDEVIMGGNYTDPAIVNLDGKIVLFYGQPGGTTGSCELR